MIPLNLTRWQRSRLRRQLQDTSDARVYRRTLAVLEASQGRSVAQIAQALNVTRQSVYHWIASYAATCDPEVLIDADRSGRPSSWTDELRGLLRGLFAQTPDQLGYFAVNWTVPLLQEQLEHQTGHRLAEDTIRRELDRLGYVWKRSRYILDPDPEREKKTAFASGDARNPGN